MIPSFRPGILSSNSIRKAAAAADVTPNAVDWTDYTSGSASGDPSFILGTSGGAKTISGINTAILIYPLCNYCGDSGQLYYKKNGGSWTAIADSETISISNGDTLDWGYNGFPGGFMDIAVINSSDNGAILDSTVSFDWTIF